MGGSTLRAFRLFERVSGLEPGAHNLFNQALALYSLCRYEDALQILENIDMPENAMLGMMKGQVYLLTCQWDKAEAQMRELCGLNPNRQRFTQLLNIAIDPILRDKYRLGLDLQLRSAMLQEDGNYRQAYELLCKASELRPDDASIQNNLGVLAMKQKLSSKAVLGHFSAAVHLAPDDDRFKRHYLKVWRKIGKNTVSE
ncbi:MAG: hypothetical protein PHI68_03465 [Candidatus Cloacimonetes bacterium]|nr:hypothetical protein [Candidatus Cloacimonadota bacterium]